MHTERPNLTSRFDVITDVINIKSTFSGIISSDLSISYIEMNLSEIFRNFQNGRHVEVLKRFLSGIQPEVDYNVQIDNPVPYIVSF